MPPVGDPGEEEYAYDDGDGDGDGDDHDQDYDDHDHGDDHCSFESVDRQESKFNVLKKKATHKSIYIMITLKEGLSENQEAESPAKKDVYFDVNV